MKSFVFITHLTPVRFRSPLRESLISVMRKSLQMQEYRNWRALWIGEEEREADNIKEVRVDNSSREALAESLREIYERSDVKEFIGTADYISKLDDDDVISETALKKASELDFDCYCDKYHSFYDVVSGAYSQQKRPWIASTALHKREHAFFDPLKNLSGSSLLNGLFYGHHANDWIRYYEQKNVVFAERHNPLYLRVLSPSSITAGAGGKLQTFDQIDMKKYTRYRSQFGTWNNPPISGFERLAPALDQVWPIFSGKAHARVNISMRQKLKFLLRRNDD